MGHGTTAINTNYWSGNINFFKANRFVGMPVIFAEQYFLVGFFTLYAFGRVNIIDRLSFAAYTAANKANPQTIKERSNETHLSAQCSDP